jgi:hypothetical protein
MSTPECRVALQMAIGYYIFRLYKEEGLPEVMCQYYNRQLEQLLKMMEITSPSQPTNVGSG